MKYLKNVVSLQIDPERCTGCGRCVEVCPQKVLRLEEGRARVVDRDLCIECGACALNCAPGAVVSGRGVGCAAAVIGALRSGGEPECGCCCTDDDHAAPCC
jgi:NAD-dependent dihydropyrimidine dehydrogenase PreA subunit